MQSAFL